MRTAIRLVSSAFRTVRLLRWREYAMGVSRRRRRTCRLVRTGFAGGGVVSACGHLSGPAWTCCFTFGTKCHSCGVTQGRISSGAQCVLFLNRWEHSAQFLRRMLANRLVRSYWVIPCHFKESSPGLFFNRKYADASPLPSGRISLAYPRTDAGLQPKPLVINRLSAPGCNSWCRSCFEGFAGLSKSQLTGRSSTSIVDERSPET